MESWEERLVKGVKQELKSWGKAEKIAVAFCVVLVALNFSGYSIYNLILNPLGYNIYQIVSGSMQPTLEINDWIITVSPTDLKERDIIVYKHPFSKDLIAHRITKIEGDTIQTKGDNNPGPDPYPVQMTDILGKVTITIPHLYHEIPRYLLAIAVVITIIQSEIWPRLTKRKSAASLGLDRDSGTAIMAVVRTKCPSQNS